MIVSFGNKLADDLFHGVISKPVRSFPAELRGKALQKLDVVNFAAALEDLRVPPGNRLESLKGNLAGYHSIRINDQWRIVFRWVNEHSQDVQIVDYH